MGNFDDGEPAWEILRKDTKNTDNATTIKVAILKKGYVPGVVGNSVDSVIYTFYENPDSEGPPIQRICKAPSKSFEETFIGGEKSIVIATLKLKDGHSVDVNVTAQMAYWKKTVNEWL